MIAKLCGLALDARAHAKRDLIEAAEASRWIAANALAIRGHRLLVAGGLPRGGAACARVSRFGELLAALAAAPSLLSPHGLPARWRFALQLLGVPLLADPNAPGVCVVSLAPWAGWSIAVEKVDTTYLVRMSRAHQLLAA